MKCYSSLLLIRLLISTYFSFSARISLCSYSSICLSLLFMICLWVCASLLLNAFASAILPCLKLAIRLRASCLCFCCFRMLASLLMFSSFLVLCIISFVYGKLLPLSAYVATSSFAHSQSKSPSFDSCPSARECWVLWVVFWRKWCSWWSWDWRRRCRISAAASHDSMMTSFSVDIGHWRYCSCYSCIYLSLWRALLFSMLQWSASSLATKLLLPSILLSRKRILTCISKQVPVDPGADVLQLYVLESLFLFLEAQCEDRHYKNKNDNAKQMAFIQYDK